jgi:hypothetical protein
MALLLRWVHPDLDPDGVRSLYATRVTRAWDDLKTEQRRQVYDASLGKERDGKKKSRPKLLRHRSRSAAKHVSAKWRGETIKFAPRRGLVRRAILSLFSRT